MYCNSSYIENKVLVLEQYQKITSCDDSNNIFTLKPVLRVIKQFLSGFIFQECQSYESEVLVWVFPNHSCQKSLSKSLGFASWLGKTFLAFVIWKNPYSHFLFTGLVHFPRFVHSMHTNLRKWGWRSVNIWLPRAL